MATTTNVMDAYYAEGPTASSTLVGLCLTSANNTATRVFNANIGIFSLHLLQTRELFVLQCDTDSGDKHRDQL